jgi:hypothetical protein
MVSDLLLLQKIHGHIALLGLALCLHPPIALRRAKRTTRAVRISAYLASGFVLAANVLGWVIYPAYREEVKLDLYRHARPIGLLFEVKEHLAWFAFALAAAGLVLTWASGRPEGAWLKGGVARLYLVMGVLMVLTSVMGVWIASVHGFSYGLGVAVP